MNRKWMFTTDDELEHPLLRDNEAYKSKKDSPKKDGF